MTPWILKSLLVIVTVTCVLVVFVAPTIDLPYSALRASQIAHNLMACIAFVNLLSTLTLILPFFFAGPGFLVPHSDQKSAPVLCTFLC